MPQEAQVAVERHHQGGFGAGGAGAALLLGPAEGTRAEAHYYFEVAAVVTAFLLLGRWLESRAQSEGRSALTELAREAIAQVQTSGQDVSLEAMNPFERKVVHDVAKREGLRSESDGDGKGRHVVIYPAS